MKEEPFLQWLERVARECDDDTLRLYPLEVLQGVQDVLVPITQSVPI